MLVAPLASLGLLALASGGACSDGGRGDGGRSGAERGQPERPASVREGTGTGGGVGDQRGQWPNGRGTHSLTEARPGDRRGSTGPHRALQGRRGQARPGESDNDVLDGARAVNVRRPTGASGMKTARAVGARVRARRDSMLATSTGVESGGGRERADVGPSGALLSDGRSAGPCGRVANARAKARATAFVRSLDGRPTVRSERHPDTTVCASPFSASLVEACLKASGSARGMAVRRRRRERRMIKRAPVRGRGGGSKGSFATRPSR